jgi:hypothetical protein
VEKAGFFWIAALRALFGAQWISTRATPSTSKATFTSAAAASVANPRLI